MSKQDTEDLIAQLDEMSGVQREEGESVAEFLQGEEAEVANPETEDVEKPEEEESAEEQPEEEGDKEGEEEVEADAEAGDDEEPAEEEAEEEDVNISDLETLRAQYDELLKQNEQLLRSPQQQEPAQQQQQQQVEQPGVQEQAQEFAPLGFLENDDDYEAAFSDREAMNRLLSRVYYTAEQNILQKASLMADQQMTMMFRANMVRENFLKDNPEFEPASEMLGLMVNKVANEKPDASLEEALNEAASRLKKSGVVKTGKKPGRIQGQKPKGKNRPGFAKGTSSRPSRKGDSRSTLQRDLDSME